MATLKRQVPMDLLRKEVGLENLHSKYRTRRWAFRQWEETFWSDEAAEALRADMEQYPEGIERSADETSDCSSVPESGGVSDYVDYVDVDSNNLERERRLKIVLSAGALGFLFCQTAGETLLCQ